VHSVQMQLLGDGSENDGLSSADAERGELTDFVRHTKVDAVQAL